MSAAFTLADGDGQALARFDSLAGMERATAALDASADVMTAVAQGRLKSFIERVERLEEDKAAVAEDLKSVFSEAKGEGFDVKILRRVVKLRKQDRAKRLEEEAILDLYISAIGGL